MIPVMQTKFGYPDGNCNAACLASITGIPLEDFPDLSHFGKDSCNSRARIIDEFLLSRGWLAWEIVTEWMGYKLVPRGYIIAGGLSPREIFYEDGERVQHSVIYLDGKPYHDPHPDGTFLDGPVLDWTILIQLTEEQDD